MQSVLLTLAADEWRIEFILLLAMFQVIFPFQFASFLMTLVRKGIITTKGFHAGYLWSLWMVVWLILGPQTLMLSVASWSMWIMLYIWRSYGLSKYALWFGPLLSKMLSYFKVTPENPVVELGMMMLGGCLSKQLFRIKPRRTSSARKPKRSSRMH